MDKVIGVVIMFVVAIVLIALLFAIPVMYLWDWLMPELFGLGEITLMQSLGLIVFTGILFKSSK